jgi:sodium-dependent dicarboxylate transporter 2/3/5
MSEAAQKVAAVTVWMATWWLTVPVPLEATALLPLILLPLAGTASFDRAAAPYANPVIFLFLGGFFLAAAMERWGLHKRIAYGILGLVGTDARRVVAAFMAATAFLSMWISNTATTVMMMPMAVAVLVLWRAGPGASGRDESGAGFGVALVLGVAYAATIGGMATLIGTPPNAIFAGAVRQLLDRDFSFGSWLGVGLPVVAVLLPACWLLLITIFPVRSTIEGLGEKVTKERAALGRLEGAERWTLVVFLLAVAAWVLRDSKDLGWFTLPGLVSFAPALTDPVIAIAAALLLFLVPVSWREWRFALDWPVARTVPWGMLLLFGGGLSLAESFQTSGLSEWLGGLLGGMAGSPRVVIVAVVAATFVFMSDLASNAAIAAMAMPLMAAIAPALGEDPVRLMQVAALAASGSFLLPVSTPPNTVAFATGEVSVPQIVKAGIWMDLLTIATITLLLGVLL